jgi:membrane protein required for beta-lactamase induction
MIDCRVKLWLCDPDLYPDADFIHTVPRGKLHAFTMLQVVCLMSLWTLRTSHWGIMFPLLIMALLPIRNCVATQLVDRQYLAVLDAD